MGTYLNPGNVSFAGNCNSALIKMLLPAKENTAAKSSNMKRILKRIPTFA